jgi:hypothetical protein
VIAVAFSFRHRRKQDLAEMFEHTMTTVLIVAGLGVVAAAVGAAALWYRSTQAADMGNVSHTWVAELRAGEPYDSNR